MSTKIRFDSILLFALVIPFVMAYRIGTGDTPPYWLFGVIFLLLTGYILIDLLRLSDVQFTKWKNIVLVATMIIVIGSAFTSAIIVRHKTHPIYMIHDIILQQEAALQFLVHGKNPYAETYFGTFMEQWHYADNEVNPALYHFVMEPFYLVSAVPFYVLSNHTIGYFDGRIPLLVLFALMIGTGYFIAENPEQKRLFMILLAFHPSLLQYTLEGRSDVYMYAFLLLGFYLLQKRKYVITAILLALAFAIKQSAWPLMPFYLLYLYWKEKDIKKVATSTAIFLLSFSLVVLPFIVWNPSAFYDSTIAFLSGTTKYSYPISGYGLGSLLLQFGVIKDKFAYYPFTFWQLGVGIPALLMLGVYFKQLPSVKRMILCYGLFLFLFWYLSRYFNNSHLGYLSLVLITAYFWPEEEAAPVKSSGKNSSRKSPAIDKV